MFLFHECVVPPQDRFLLQFYHFGLKKNFFFATNDSFSKRPCHLSTNFHQRKRKKELMWLNIVRMAKQFPKTHVGDQFSK